MDFFYDIARYAYLHNALAYRKYTISEIINAIIGNGFTLERFDEHPAWENEKLPGEYTAVAKKM